MKFSRLVIVAVSVLGVLRAVRGRDAGAAPAASELRYHVPVGQDAAAVLAAVLQAGFEAKVEMAGGDEDVVVSCDPRRDQEQLRQVLQNAPVDMAGHPFNGPPVVFVGE